MITDERQLENKKQGAGGQPEYVQNPTPPPLYRGKSCILLGGFALPWFQVFMGLWEVGVPPARVPLVGTRYLVQVCQSISEK